MTGRTPHRAVPPELHVLHTAMRAGLQITKLTDPERASIVRPSECQTNALPVRPLRVKDYSKNRAAKDNKKALALFLKPASPTPSNTGLARSFQRDTERRIKVVLYREVLQRGGAQVYRCTTRAPRETRTGTHGPGRAPLRGSLT